MCGGVGVSGCECVGVWVWTHLLQPLNGKTCLLSALK